MIEGARAAGPCTARPTGAPGHARPTPAEVERFRGELRQRGDALRTRTSIELTFVDALLREGAVDGAADVVGEYASVLRAYSDDVCALLRGSVPVPTEPPAVTMPLEGAGGVQEPGVVAPRGQDGLAEEPRVRPLRRALVGALLSAVIAATVIGAGVRTSGLEDSRLAAAELAAREELTVARERFTAIQQAPSPDRAVPAEARALHDQILALPRETLRREVVRVQIRELLDLELAALQDVVPATPEALDLIGEIKAIRTSLQLDPPVLPAAAEATEDVTAVEEAAPTAGEPAVPVDPEDAAAQAPGVEVPAGQGPADEAASDREAAPQRRVPPRAGGLDPLP